MSLASGPGRGGGAGSPAEESDHKLFVQKHVDYIKSLDTVRLLNLVILVDVIASLSGLTGKWINALLTD